MSVGNDGASEITITGTPTSIDGLSGTLTLVGGGIIDITNDSTSQITINAGVGQELSIITRTAAQGAPSAAGEVEGTVVKFGTTTGMTAEQYMFGTEQIGFLLILLLRPQRKVFLALPSVHQPLLTACLFRA